MADRFRDLKWKPLRRELVGDFRIFRLYRQYSLHPPTEKEAQFTILDTPNWINVVSLTPEREVVLIRQYRHGTGEITLEIPGGMVDPNETPLQAAQRELFEETGYRSQHWSELGVVTPNPAFQNNRCWTFLASDVQFVGQNQGDEHEFISVELVPLREIPKLLDSGEINHSLVVAAFFHYFRKFGKLE